jgi:hypothetical protein
MLLILPQKTIVRQRLTKSLNDAIIALHLGKEDTVNIITCLTVVAQSMWADATNGLVGALVIVGGVAFFGGLLYLGYEILRAGSNIGRRD